MEEIAQRGKQRRKYRIAKWQYPELLVPMDAGLALEASELARCYGLSLPNFAKLLIASAVFEHKRYGNR